MMRMKEKSKARRRVRTRAALFLTAVSFTGLISLGVLRLTVQMSALSSVALGAAGTLVCFLLPALAGLFLIDGDQSAMLPMRSLSAQHRLFLSLTGALLVCPMSLLADFPGAALRLMGFALPERAAGALDASLFLPCLLASGVLAPICEELFFRGYLMGVFTRFGRGRAVVSSALLFSLAHGMDMAFLPRALTGALLGAMTMRTGSLFAAMLVHGCYNIAIILINFSGASGLFMGYSMLSCAVRLMGSALCWGAYARACRARMPRVTAEIRIGGFKKKEIMLLAAATLATAAAVAITGVMKP